MTRFAEDLDNYKTHQDIKLIQSEKRDKMNSKGNNINSSRFIKDDNKLIKSLSDTNL